MNRHHVIAVLLIVASSLIPRPVGAYELDYEVDSEYSSTDYGLYATATATYGSGMSAAEALAGAYVSTPANASGYAEAYAYRELTVYVTDYDSQEDPTLTAEVDSGCSARVTASWEGTPSYYVRGAAMGYGAGESCSLDIDISYPDTLESELDSFVKEKDMSYNGASCSFGDCGVAQADIYSTSLYAIVGARGNSYTTVSIVED